MSISRRSGEVVLRSDLVELGGRSQLSEALKTLMTEGKLLRLGSGVYAKARKDSLGHIHLAGEPEHVVEEVFLKLGLQVRLVRVEADGDRDLYVMDASGLRVARKLEIGAGHVHYVRAKGRPAEAASSQIPDDLDMLPTSGVSAFVEQIARAHHIVHERTRFDDWAEAVTRAAGDQVRLDRTEKLLVALKKKNLINGRQAARLLTNHMREAKNVRSVPGLRNGRISPQR